jgi:hypothetical protein
MITCTTAQTVRFLIISRLLLVSNSKRSKAGEKSKTFILTVTPKLKLDFN